MADAENWRAQRAAQLAGTPFARPAPAESLDATMPMAVVAATAASRLPAAAGARPARSPNGGFVWLLAMASAVLAVVVGVVVWRWHAPVPVVRSPVSAPAAVAVPAPVPVTPAVPAVAPVLPAVSPEAAPPDTASAAVQPAATTARPHSTRHPTSPPAKHAARREGDRHRSPAERRHRGDPGVAAPRRPTGRTSPATTVKATSQGAAALPICQPGVVSRAPRPCRPSHDRYVRKPFYSN